MLTIKNLSVQYNNGVSPLTNINLALEEGHLYGIIGPSGAGKSSFLKGILNLVPTTGEVTFRNQKIKDFSKKIAYVEQKENIDRAFPITVFQCVLMGTYPNLGFFHRPGMKEKKATQKAIDYVGLSGFESRQIGELSGGQFQRVLIARSIVQDAEIFFMDEPFVGIDVKNEATIIQLLKKMVEEGKTLFVVHHNLNNVKNYFDRVILINGEIIAFGKTEEVFTNQNIIKTYKLVDSPLEEINLSFHSSKN